MNVLVTGADGFVGSWLIPELERGGHTVVGLGDDVDVRDPAWPNELDWRTVDGPRSLRLKDFDVCVHLAALVGRLNCEHVHEPGNVIATNAAGTLNVAKACARANVRMVYVSTSEAIWNGNLYGLTKRWGEEAARHYATDTGLDVLRLYMAYGPGHPPGEGSAALTNFLWAAMHDEPIVVHDGAARPWCWIGDTVMGIRLIVESTRDRRPDVWEVGGTNVTPMLEVASMAIALTRSSSAIESVPLPERGVLAVKSPKPSYLRGLGWLQTVDLVEGMERTLEWLRTLPSDGIGSPPRVAVAGALHGGGGGK